MNDVKDKLEKTKSKDHKEKKNDRNITSNQETEVAEEVEELDATNVDVEDDDSLLTELSEGDPEDDENSGFGGPRRAARRLSRLRLGGGGHDDPALRLVFVYFGGHGHDAALHLSDRRQPGVRGLFRGQTYP